MPGNVLNSLLPSTSMNGNQIPKKLGKLWYGGQWEDPGSAWLHLYSDFAILLLCGIYTFYLLSLLFWCYFPFFIFNASAYLLITCTVLNVMIMKRKRSFSKNKILEKITITTDRLCRFPILHKGVNRK